MKTTVLNAAKEGNLSLVRLLLSKGAKPDTAQRRPVLFNSGQFCVQDCTPLIAACAEGHSAVAEYLLQSGADPDQQAEDGMTALHVAAFLDRTDVISVLRKYGANLNSRMQNGDTPLLAALSMNRYAAAIALMEAGADVRVRDGFLGNTALHSAVYTTDPHPSVLKCIRLLLEKGADVNAANNAGLTALHHAALGSASAVRILLAQGADVNAADFIGKTPLSNAFANAESVRLLLQAGADVNHVDAFGQPAVFEAIRGKHFEVVRILLAGGADVNITAHDGTSALSLAEDCRDARIMKLLQKHAGKRPTSTIAINQLLCASVKSGDAHALRRLLSDGANPNATSEGESALLLAVRKKDTAMAERLLQSGADVNFANSSGRTPLHHAAAQGVQKLVRLLMEAGAEVDRLDTDGWTPLMAACEGGNARVVRMLLDAGASVEAKSKDGTTPLLLSARYGHRDATAMLLAAGAQHPHAAHFLEIVELADRLKQPKYEKAIRDLSKICGTQPLRTPGLFRSGAFFDLSRTPLSKTIGKQLKLRFVKQFAGRNHRNQHDIELNAAKISEMYTPDMSIQTILDKAQAEFLKRGCLLLFVHQLPGNKLALLPTINPFAAVAWLGPHPKGPVHMIEFLLNLSKKYRWTLRGCSYDELQLQFHGKPRDSMQLARLLYSVGSDEKGVVRDGLVELAETKKQFAAQLNARNPIVRLWWD